MTNQHPITPPPELVQQWIGDYYGCPVSGELSGVETAIAARAAKWGADQELEACCGVINGWFAEPQYRLAELRAARRPNPPSLKEQALGLLNEGPVSELLDHEVDTIRRALEQLDD